MPALLTHRLLDTVARCAAREAFVSDGARVSYADFGHMIDGCARELRERGVRRGERVALALPNGAAAAAVLYGAWRLGAIAVPLNVQARARDLAAWMRHSRPRVLVCDAGNADAQQSLQALDEAPQWLDAAVLDVAAHSAHAGELPFAPAALVADDIALIQYTSGTTGRPKGVTLTHANLASNVDAIVKFLGVRESDSVLSVLPFNYAYGASVLHTHLAVGGRIVLESSLVYPQQVVETMARERVSGLSGVAATFGLLLARVELAKFDLGSLRYLTQAGGAMSPSLAQRLQCALPQARLYLMYGQTEATARLSWLPPERLADKPGSAGIAIDGVRLEIQDDMGRPVPPGVEGEVCARGPNIMQGYWADAETSAHVLRDGWLHTGDLGRMDAAGFLYLAGRRADMIKTGAHRVNPADVEEVIAELPAVAEVAVVGVDDELLGQVIKACVVGNGSQAVSAMEIKAHCRARLAAYMVPKLVEFRGSLPRTASGKVQRFALERCAP